MLTALDGPPPWPSIEAVEPVGEAKRARSYCPPAPVHFSGSKNSLRSHMMPMAQ